MGSRSLWVILVSGKRRLPVPSAKTIPFIVAVFIIQWRKMPHYDWSQVPAEQLNPQVTRRAIHTPAITVARLNMAKGTIVPAHQHVNEQFTMVESGALRFNLGGQELILRPGEA